MSSDHVSGQQFSPDMTALINGAYEDAASVFDLRNGHAERRAMLARFIIDLARDGQTNRTELRDQAVAAVKRSEWVRHQAHEIWEAAGRPLGRNDEHWAQAEQEWAERGRDSV